ncbi:hypothetical protein BD769DRAFT_1520910, partial [Suillus cothurnatus]
LIPPLVPSDNSTHSSPSSSSSTPSHTTMPLHGRYKAADLEYLIYHLRDHLLKERPELFMENGTIRPGILVLINNTDWELEGEDVFISTLHGG